MKLSDETLMEYADGELGRVERAAVEAAIASDPEVSARVMKLRAQRDALRSAFDDVLDEPVPERLIVAARTAPADRKVVALERLRAKRVKAALTRWSWPQWTAMAVSLLVGLIVGRTMLAPDDALLVAAAGGGLVAHGALAAALTEQLSGEPAHDPSIDIGVSYRAKGGEYCRTFSTTRVWRSAGIACRDQDAWGVRALSSERASASGEYRMAGTALPPQVLKEVEASIDGEPLDAAGERAARERHWRE